MKYKALFFGFFAFLCLDFSALAYFNLDSGATKNEHKLVKRDDPPSLGDIPEFVQGINDMRRKYAKRYQVPDMHELVWDEDLLKTLNSLDGSLSWKEARITWRYVKLKSFRIGDINMEEELDAYLYMDEDVQLKLSELSANSLELINPLQKFIACRPEGTTDDAFGICLIGVEGRNFTLFNTLTYDWDEDGERKERQDLGTNCSEGYQNEDGLCTPIDRSKVSYLGFPENFVKDLNAMRRHYAQEYNVSDMHELIWNEDLLKILNSLDGSLSWKEARLTWRYVKLKSFRIGDINMDEELKAYLAMDDDAKQKHSELSAHNLELINPLQKLIACRPETTKEVFVICLIGVEGEKFTLFDVTNTAANATGTKCSKGYKNEDGLCTAEHKPLQTYIGSLIEFIADLNEQRRHYAKEYRVTDMHELVWNDDLAKILAPLNWQNSWPEALKTWRYAKVESFRTSLAADLERDVAYFQNLDEAKRTEFKSRKSTNALEFLNPLQTMIACKTEWDPKNKQLPFGVCLVGGEGAYTIFDPDDTSFKFEVEQCARGYKGVDHLCTPVDKSKVHYLGDPEDFLHDVNQLRRRYATEYNVPDMHELVWSPDLVTILDNLNWDSTWTGALKTWRFDSMGSFRLSKSSIEKDINAFLAKDQAGRTAQLTGITRTAGSLEYVNPRQKFLGCGVKWRKDDKSAFGVCLIGPEGPFTMFDMNNKDNTTALGSKCSAGHKNSYGLCIPIYKHKALYIGYAPDFIKEMNELRRNYAKQYNVPDMHELIWNDDLAKILEKLDWSKGWPEARITWRYTGLISFRTSTIDMDAEIKAYLAANDNDKQYKSDWTAHRLELINPLQKFIACGVKWDKAKTEFVGVCLVGPEGPKFTMFNMDSKDPSVLGSKCSKRYTNKDGLCVPDDTSKEFYLGSTENFLEEVNELRRHYAKQYNTPNMYELTWDDDLVVMVDNVKKNEFPYYQPLFVRLDSFHNLGEQVKYHMKKYLPMDQNGRKEYLLKNNDSLVFIDPAQMFIGCKPRRFNDGDIQLHAMCLIGPEKPFTMLDVDSKSKDILGSQCREKFNNTDGLCTPARWLYHRYITRFPGSDFLDKVNAVRRQYAKEYNVPDMHELVYNEKFYEEIWDRHKWKLQVKPEYDFYRLAKVLTFHSIDKFLVGRMNEWLAKDEDERQKEIDRSWWKSRFELELLNPVQKTLGCAIDWNENKTDFFGTCLIGPDGSKFTMFDVNGKSTNVLGSNCSEGYVHNDGLCSLPPTTTLPPPTTPTPKSVPTTPAPTTPATTTEVSTLEPEKKQEPLVVEESELSSSPSTRYVIAIALFVFLYLV